MGIQTVALCARIRTGSLHSPNKASSVQVGIMTRLSYRSKLFFSFLASKHLEKAVVGRIISQITKTRRYSLRLSQNSAPYTPVGLDTVADSKRS